MLIQFTNETSRPATGARPPVGSHMRGGGAPRNLNSFPSGASLERSEIAQAALDVIALVVNLAVPIILICSAAAVFGASIFFLLFCRF